VTYVSAVQDAVVLGAPHSDLVRVATGPLDPLRQGAAVGLPKQGVRGDIDDPNLMDLTGLCVLAPHVGDVEERASTIGQEPDPSDLATPIDEFGQTEALLILQQAVQVVGEISDVAGLLDAVLGGDPLSGVAVGHRGLLRCGGLPYNYEVTPVHHGCLGQISVTCTTVFATES
jgi:hypothetical protein